MSELFENVVVRLIGGSRPTRVFADELGIESDEVAQASAVLAVPVVVANMARLAGDPSGTDQLMTMIGSLKGRDPASGSPPRDGAGFSDHDLVSVLLGTRHDDVVEAVASRAALNWLTAERLLAKTARVVTATLTESRGSNFDELAVTSVLAQNCRELIDGGWGPWIEQTTGSGFGAFSVASQPTAISPIRTATASVDDDTPRPAHVQERVKPAERSVWLPVVAAIVVAGAILALVSLAITKREGADEVAAGRAEDQSGVSSDTGGQSSTGSTVRTTPPADDRVESSDAVAVQMVDADSDEVGGDWVEIAVSLQDPSGGTDRSGVAQVRFDTVTGEICFDVTTTGVGSPYRGHIHVGEAGTKGGIVSDFGTLTNVTSDCVDSRPIDTNAILANPGGHYVMFHDPDVERVIRGQLSDVVTTPMPGSGQMLFDPDGGGATTAIEPGIVTVGGEVPDQATADALMVSFADIDLGATELVNALQVVENAPLPSGRILVDDAILFGFDSDVIDNPEATVLLDLAAMFNARPQWSLTIVGHTDDRGTDVYNLELSLRRATAVRDALEALEVPTDAIRTEGAGSTEPVANNKTDEGRRQNRRIEFQVNATAN